MSEKIYVSKASEPDAWPEAKSYWFPFAEWLGRRGIWWPAKAYISLRMFIERTCAKCGREQRRRV